MNLDRSTQKILFLLAVLFVAILIYLFPIIHKSVTISKIPDIPTPAIYSIIPQTLQKEVIP